MPRAPMTLRIRQAGLNLIEMMIALTLSLFIVLGLSVLFVNSSRSERELAKSAEQIENGRYAMETLSRDIWAAGFYGYMFAPPPAPAVAPNPCELNDLGLLYSAMSNHVQVFWAAGWAVVPDLSTTTCGPRLPNLTPGSDVIVVRRANTLPLLPSDRTQLNDIYLQTNTAASELQIGSGGLVGTTYRANGRAAADSPTLLLANGAAGPIFKYHVHIYFVSQCSQPTGSGGACRAEDDGGTWIPSLKRLELVSVGGVTELRTITVADGIEAMRVDLGIDDDPNSVDTLTRSAGDGVPDSDPFIRASANPTVDFSNAMAADIRVLARNSAATPDYIDAKTYDFGPVSGARPAAGDGYPRRLYVGRVAIANPAMRRQIPQ